MAHHFRDSRNVDLSSVAHTNETYDLVIVVGGISGLEAAYYFLTTVGRGARMLILDNHDDFGGHAPNLGPSVYGTVTCICSSGS